MTKKTTKKAPSNKVTIVAANLVVKIGGKEAGDIYEIGKVKRFQPDNYSFSSGFTAAQLEAIAKAMRDGS